MRNSLLQVVFEESQAIALHLGFDAHFLPIVASLVAALALITAFITLLVWLRYFVMTGFITFCVVSGLRRTRKERRGPGPGDVVGAIPGDAHGMISPDEHNLEIENVD